MRPLFSLLVVLALLAGGLAGCVGEEEPAAPAGTDATLAPERGSAANASVVDDGSREADADLGEQPHIHDYWMGAERLTLMDEDVKVEPWTALAFTFFNTFTGTPGVGGAFVTLPDGKVVFEGTGEMEITVTWSEPTITGMGVRVRDASATQFGEEQALAMGQPFLLQVTPEMTDMPHAKSSRWMFLFTPSTAGEAIVGTFHLKVDIIKTRDPTMYPGHPDLFGDASTLTLFDGTGSSSQTSFVNEIVNFALQNPQDDSVASQKVVPMETQTMTGNLTITGSSTTLGEVADVWLEYKSADSFRYRRAQLVESDPATGTYQFAWPVDMAQTDSPYADESAWRFRVRATTDPTGTGELENRGLSDAQIDFTLVVVAYDALLAGVETTETDARGAP